MNPRMMSRPVAADIPSLRGDQSAFETSQPTLANTAACIEKNLIAAHGVLDQIEQAIHGPTPMPGDNPKSPCGGLMGALGECNTSAHGVLRRLESVLAAVENVKN